jgi:formylmethanofuran dehydrogenase subunit E
MPTCQRSKVTRATSTPAKDAKERYARRSNFLPTFDPISRNKIVFFAPHLQIFETERITSKSFSWHRKCYCCVKCSSPLNAAIHYAQEGSDEEIYCKSCFKKTYPNTDMPKIYSDTSVIKPKDGEEGGCPRCEGSVFQVIHS